MLFTVLLLLMCDALFQRISDSRFTLIHDLLMESVRLVLFFAEYLICRHLQTHGVTERRTDRLTN